MRFNFSRPKIRRSETDDEAKTLRHNVCSGKYSLSNFDVHAHRFGPKIVFRAIIQLHIIDENPKRALSMLMSGTARVERPKCHLSLSSQGPAAGNMKMIRRLLRRLIRRLLRRLNYASAPMQNFISKLEMIRRLLHLSFPPALSNAEWNQHAAIGLKAIEVKT